MCNPIYLAALPIVLGEAWLFLSLALLAYAGAMAVLFHLFVTGYEEPTLRRRFGSTYLEYQRMVSRWIPRRPQPGLGTRFHPLPYARILRPRRSAATCATCGLYSAQARVVRDYLVQPPCRAGRAVLGGPAVRAASGGSLSLPWLLPMVVPQQ